MAKHTIPEENFKNIKNFTFDNVLEVRQYLLCTAKELGIIDADNKIISANVVEQFRMDIEKRSVVEEIVGKCETDSKAETPEDVMIYKFFTCLLSDQNEIGQKILAAAKQNEPLTPKQPATNQDESDNAVNDKENDDLQVSPDQPDPLKNNNQNSGQEKVQSEDVPVL